MGKKSLITALSFLLVLSCTFEKVEVNNTDFSIDKSTLNYDVYGGSLQVSVTSGSRWWISEKPAWLNVGTIETSPNTPFKWSVPLSCSKNEGADLDGKVVFKNAENKTFTLIVSQKGAKIPVTKVELSEELKNALLNMEVGDEVYLQLTITPSNATDQEVTWSTRNNDEVVTIYTSGLVKAQKKGSAIIQATVDGITAEFPVIVYGESIKFADSNVESVCLQWDTDKNGKLSYDEAKAVSSSQFQWAFSGNSKITSFSELQYFTGLTELANYEFSGCTSLKSITLPSTIESIGNNAFDGCSSLTTIKIPDSVTSIREAAFRGCSNLSSFTGKWATSNGRALVLDNKMVAFAPSGYTYYTIPSTVTSIESYTFDGCSGLTSITIPANATSLGSYAFANCTGLKTVVVPEKISSVGSYAFYSCTGLASIECKPTTPPSGGSNMFANTNNCDILVPDDSVNDYRNKWSTYYSRIKGINSGKAIQFVDDNVRTICINKGWDKNGDSQISYEEVAALTSLESAFAGKSISSFDELQHFKGLKTIENMAFDACSNLKSVTLPPQVTSIGTSAFRNCSSLTSIDIPSSVTSAGYGAFRGCIKLSRFTGNGAADSGHAWILNNHIYAFAPSGLTTYTIPNGVTHIEQYTFYACSALTSVVIPESVNTIGAYAFYSCSNLSKIECNPTTPPAGGSNMFTNTSNCDIIVPDASVDAYKQASVWSSYSNRIKGKTTGNVITFADDNVRQICVNKGWDQNNDKKISDWEAAAVNDQQFGTSFRNSSITSFNELQYFTGLSALNNYAFEGCTSLSNITLPSQLTSIGYGAFRNCSSLTQIDIPSKVTSIDYEAFRGCGRLQRFSGKFAVSDRTLVINGTIIAFAPFGKTTYDIPSTVTSIGAYAFYGCSGLTSVTIPANTTSIGSYAFYNCSGLTKVVIPQNVSSIGASAFYNCSGLTSIECNRTTPPTAGSNMFYGTSNCDILVPDNSVSTYKSKWSAYSSRIKAISTASAITFADDNVRGICVAKGWDTNKDNKISKSEAAAVTSLNGAFTGKTIITSFDELQYFTGLSSIEAYAFDGCTGLQSVKLPSQLSSIGNNAFNNCSSLKAISIPDNVSTLSGYIFLQCTALESVVLPSGLTSLSQGLFSGCTKLESVSIPSGVKTIGSYAFYNCSSLTSLTLPAGLTVIENRVLYGCSGLKSIVIPAKVTTINQYAFYKCSSLTSIEIPQQVSTIGNYAFGYCSKLSKIVCLPTTPPSGSATMFTGTALVDIVVPDGTVTVYRNAPYWSNYASVIKDQTSGDVISFEDLAVRDICVQNGWDENHDGQISFWEAQKVESLGEAFKGSSIKSFNELQYFTGLTSISENAFNGCSSMTAITLPKEVTTIQKSAFQDCPALPSITIPAEVTFLGSRVFQGCSKLQSITVPSKVADLGEYAFADCIALKSVQLPTVLTTIKKNTFDGCKALSSINNSTYIPSNITIIMASAFSGCTSLPSITFYSSIESIGASAFYNCTGLSFIECKRSKHPTGGNKMFDGTSCPIYVPYGSLSDYQTADYWRDYKTRIKNR